MAEERLTLLERLFADRCSLTVAAGNGLFFLVLAEHGIAYAAIAFALTVVAQTWGKAALERERKINLLKRAKLWPTR